MSWWRLFLLLVVGTGLMACSDEEDPYEPAPLVDLDNQFETRVLWSTDVGDGLNGTSGKLAPAFAYKKIFTADEAGLISAVSPDNGKLLWQVETNAELGGGPTVANNVIAVGSHQGELILLSAEDGKELWRQQLTGEIVSSPAVGEGFVVVRTVDGKIYAFNLETGQQKWFYDQSMPTLTLRGESSPIIHGGGAIAGFSNGKLAVFILQNGQLAWEKRISNASGRSEIQRLVDVDVQPIAIGSNVYVASFNGNLASIDLRSGNFNWQRELSTFQELTVDELLLLVTQANSYVSAVNRNNGVVLWTNKKLHRRQLTAPAGYKDDLVVGDFEGYVHWLAKKDGQLLSREHLDSSGFTVKPLQLEDKVIFYSNDGTLYAIAK